MFQCLRTLEQRVQPLILSGVLGVSVLGSGCVAGPDGTTPLQRAFTQRVPYTPPQYATATPMPEPQPQYSSDAEARSTGAGILKGLSWLFGIHGDIVPAVALDITADVEGRNALIAGQREAAAVIRDGIGARASASGVAQLPSGLERVRLQEFGLVECIIASHYIDYNGNGQPERNELQPNNRLTTKSGFWVALEFFDRFSVYKPFVRLFDERGTLLTEGSIGGEGRGQYWYIGNPKNEAPPGKYVIAFFGQVPAPKNIFEQTPFGKQGVKYFIHAMPFEVVDE